MKLFLKRGTRANIRFMGDTYPVQIIAVAGETTSVLFTGERLPEVGARVDLEFKDERGIGFCYNMEVSMVPRVKGAGVVLRRAASTTRSYRRRSWRVNIQQLIVFRRYRHATDIQAIARNIGMDGMLLETKGKLRLTELLTIRLPLPGEKPHIVQARVVRKDPPVGDGAPRFGVWFVDVARETRTALTYYIWEHLRDEPVVDFPALLARARKAIEAYKDTADIKEELETPVEPGEDHIELAEPDEDDVTPTPANASLKPAAALHAKPAPAPAHAPVMAETGMADLLETPPPVDMEEGMVNLETPAPATKTAAKIDPPTPVSKAKLLETPPPVSKAKELETPLPLSKPKALETPPPRTNKAALLETPEPTYTPPPIMPSVPRSGSSDRKTPSLFDSEKFFLED